MANKINADSETEKRQNAIIKPDKSPLSKVISFDQPRLHQSGAAFDVVRSKKSADVSSFSSEPSSLFDSETGHDFVCLSHLRWDFVYQRPQHLLNRCAKERRVFFIEEPIVGDGPLRLDVSNRDGGVIVVVPHIPHEMLANATMDAIQKDLIDGLFSEHKIERYVLWYYTPMAVGFTSHLEPLAVVYDCMDELSAFKNAPVSLKQREAHLFSKADLVFTGGQTLYEAKKDQHHSVHAFPSSIDAAHFMKARTNKEDPADQREIPQPRIGFFGVIDERMNLELVAGVADARPDWHFVIIGPVVKIDEADLPRRDNIHYLGGKSYKELPQYLSGWDVAMLPFALNESTRFISPTKTPEYLAAGCPVVSTSIRDVVRPYGEKSLVHIADTVDEFVSAIDTAMNTDSPKRLMTVDAFLKQMSWDRTWAQMSALIDGVIAMRRPEAQDEAANPRVMAAAF
jgi:UDP-galactopyranose mutase